MKKMYVLSVILFFGFIVGAIYTAGATVSYFLSIPSLIMVIGLSFSLLLGTYTPGQMGSYFKLAFTGKNDGTTSLESGYHFFQAVQQYVLLSGFVGTMVGAITILALVDDKTKVGYGAALTLMTLFYALLIILLIALPFKNGCRRLLLEQETAE